MPIHLQQVMMSTRMPRILTQQTEYSCSFGEKRQKTLKSKICCDIPPDTMHQKWVYWWHFISKANATRRPSGIDAIFWNNESVFHKETPLAPITSSHHLETVIYYCKSIWFVVTIRLIYHVFSSQLEGVWTYFSTYTFSKLQNKSKRSKLISC